MCIYQNEDIRRRAQVLNIFIMDDTNREVTSSNESEENPYTSTPLSDLASSSVRTMRDYDKEVQDLKRENFNLKLRIYFLEEQNQISIVTNETQAQTTYIQQLQNEIERLRRRLQSQSAQTDAPQAIYHFGHDDERRALREELDKCREQNELLRKSIQLNSNNTSGDERRKSTTPPTPGQSIQTSTSVDSALDTTTHGMSSTLLSSNALQLELNESKERERKLQEEIYSLQKQLDSSKSQTNETLAELDRARRQLQQYELDIKNYEQQQTKAERVLQRLQNEYEARIAHLVQQQQQKTTDYESYRHEQDQGTSNVNIEEYRQAIDDRERIIQQLEETINEITLRLRTPFVLMYPSQSTTSAGGRDEQSQNLIHELNTQMQVHLETVDQLRAECVELRQSEKHLRNQIDSLTHLINSPIRNLGLPPLPRPTPSTSSKAVDAIDNAQHVEDLQRAVVQITVQLQTDAENVSSLTNRVAQIIRDRDEWQDKISRLQDEIDKKNAHIRQLEKREPEVENRIRQYFILQIENLQRDIKILQEQLKERDRLLNEKEEVRIQTRKDYEKFDSIHAQERQNFQGQLRTVNERLIDLEQHLTDERRQYDDLSKKYETIKGAARTQVEQFQSEIQQHQRQIEEFNLQIRELENTFQKEKRQIERERDIEKEKNSELQNALNVANRRFTELQSEYDQLNITYTDQQDKFDQQIRIYQKQITQFERERDNSVDELQSLRLENQTIRERSRDAEHKIAELTRKNDEFNSQVSIYKIQFQDNENLDKRHRNEIATLQRSIQDTARENQDRVHEINELRRKFVTLESDLNKARYEKERIISENQIINEQNAKLKHDIDQLHIQIRLQVQEEYEAEYRRLATQKELEIQNVLKDKEAMRYDFEQMNNERIHLGDRLKTAEHSLRQANQTVESYEIDIDRLRQALKKSKDGNEQLERDISRSYVDELKMKTDRLQDLENKYRSTETQLHQYERTIDDLRHENSKLIEYNKQLQREYEEYRFEQRNNYDALQRRFDDATRKNLPTFEEHVRTEVVHATQNKQELINKLEQQLREKDNTIKELQHARSSHQPKDLQLDLEIQIEQLEQEIEIKESFIRNYSETVQEKDLQIEKLLDDIEHGGSDNTRVLETLREELRKRDRRIDQLLNEKNSAINECERHITELQTIIRDREGEIVLTNDKLQQIQHQFDLLQLELEDCRRKRDLLTIDFNIATEENEARLDRIKILEKQLEMSQNRNQTSDQIAHFQTIIGDLKNQLQQREDSIQSLQRTIADSDRELKETRQTHSSVQGDYNRAQLRYEQMEKQHSIELENRDQNIASLRKKINDKDQEINKLRESDIAKEGVISRLRSKSRESDQDSKSEYSGARAPTNVSLRLELQKKDDLIDELKRQLDRAKSEKPSTGRETSSIVQTVEVRRRPYSANFENLNREELLYELEMALQDNDALVQQLARLIDSPSLRQRRYSAEDFDKKSSLMIQSIEESDEVNDIEKLQEIIRNQNKYIQQLQLRVRLNTPDGITLGKLTEQNKNLLLVINTYKNESSVFKTELKRLYKTIEFDQAKLKQYENVIKQQQNYIEQMNRKTNQYEQLTKKRILYPSEQNMQDDIIIDLDIDIFPANDKKKKTSLNKKDSGVESVIDSTRYTLTQQEHQRQINDKDDQIRQLTKQLNDRDDQIKQLTKQLNDLQRVHENEITQYRQKLEQSHTDLIDDLNTKQNDLRQARLQIDLLKSTKTQLEQAQDQNQRLHNEINVLQNEITNKKELVTHYEKQMDLLGKQIASRDHGTGEMSIRTSEMSELLEEMRRLRHDLERSINKQNELQIKLDENIRLTRTPREFTFTGRGISQPDLRLIDASGLIGTENLSTTHITDEKRSRPLGSSAIELVTEQINLGKTYIVGELEHHEQLRQLIADIKIELKALEVKIQEKLRSKFTSSVTEPSIEWLEHRLNSLNQCLERLEQTYQLIESYWKANLPVKNNYDEHPFTDPRVAVENNELRMSQSKYIQELQHLRLKYKEQSAYMDQVLAQLTKANHKKASTDDYLALLLRPTLDVLQKARSNMEHHLKESNNTNSLSPSSAQFRRRHRTNRLD